MGQFDSCGPSMYIKLPSFEC